MGNEIAVNSWSGLVRETAEWLVREGLLTEDRCPIGVGEMSNKYLVHTEPVHLNQNKFRQPQRLSNGLWLDPQQGGGDRIARSSILLIRKLGRDPAQFQVQLSQANEAGTIHRVRDRILASQQSSVESTFTASPAPGEWMTFTQLTEWSRTEYSLDIKPRSFRDTHGNEIAVSSWSGLLTEMAEWFIREGLLTEGKCPVIAGMRNRGNPYLIHVEPVQPNRRNFKQAKRLSNGLWLNTKHGGGERIAQLCAPMVQKLGQDPAQFHVQLSK